MANINRFPTIHIHKQTLRMQSYHIKQQTIAHGYASDLLWRPMSYLHKPSVSDNLFDGTGRDREWFGRGRTVCCVLLTFDSFSVCCFRVVHLSPKAQTSRGAIKSRPNGKYCVLVWNHLYVSGNAWTDRDPRCHRAACNCIKVERTWGRFYAFMWAFMIYDVTSP